MVVVWFRGVVGVCVFVCVCVGVCFCVWGRAAWGVDHLCARLCVWVCVCVCVCVCVYVCVCVGVGLRVGRGLCVCGRVFVQACVRCCTRVCVCVLLCVCDCVLVHINMHTVRRHSTPPQLTTLPQFGILCVSLRDCFGTLPH